MEKVTTPSGRRKCSSFRVMNLRIGYISIVTQKSALKAMANRAVIKCLVPKMVVKSERRMVVWELLKIQGQCYTTILPNFYH